MTRQDKLSKNHIIMIALETTQSRVARHIFGEQYLAEALEERK